MVDGLGVEGWVAVNDDWLCVSVGNERLLRSFGGRITLSEADQMTVRIFTETNVGATIVYICVEDDLAMILSLCGKYS
jgi:hypothetical protein